MSTRRKHTAPRHTAAKPTQPLAEEPAEVHADAGERVLGILAEAAKPLPIRTLSLAAVMPQASLADVLSKLQDTGAVVVRRQAYMLPHVAEELDSRARALQARRLERRLGLERQKRQAQGQGDEAPSVPASADARVLRILRQAKRPLAVRTLSVAARVPSASLLPLLSRLESAGDLIVRHEHVALATAKRASELEAHVFRRPQQTPARRESARKRERERRKLEREALKARRRSQGWDGLREKLPASCLAETLPQICLPRRMRRYCERDRLCTLGELVTISSETLLMAPNFGRRTLQKSFDAILNFECHRHEREAIWGSGLLESFEAHMQSFGDTRRMVALQRAGLGCPPRTFKDLGSTLGVTREQVRQYEKTALDALHRQQHWLEFIEHRFQKATHDGMTRLTELARDPWWTSATAHPQALAYISARLLGERWHVATLNDEQYLSELSQPEIDTLRAELRRRGAAVVLPQSVSHFREVFRAAVTAVLGERASKLGNAVHDVLWGDFESLLVLEHGTRRVVGFGTTKGVEVLAFLQSQAHPVASAEVWATVGRCEAPAEVFYFGRGLMGVRKHFPAFEHWHGRLVPEMTETMRTRGPKRQWTCQELLRRLREQVELPEWLGPWHLSSIARNTDQLRYLGRLRVALPGASNDSRRIYHQDLFLQILERRGEPMSFQELSAQTRQKIDFAVGAARGTLRRAPFLGVSMGIWGLRGRDEPLARALVKALKRVETLLAQHDNPLSLSFLRRELARRTQTPDPWSGTLFRSAIQHDARFQVHDDGSIGLAVWKRRGKPKARGKPKPRGRPRAAAGRSRRAPSRGGGLL